MIDTINIQSLNDDISEEDKFKAFKGGEPKQELTEAEQYEADAKADNFTEEQFPNV